MSIKHSSRGTANRRCLLLLSTLLFLSNLAIADVTVVSTVRPLQFIAAAIVGNDGATYSIEDGSHSHHNISLSPEIRLQIARAELLLWIDPAFEVELAELFSDEASDRAVITASQLAGMTLHSSGNDQIDPHLWLDSENARVIAQELARKLSAVAPDAADSFRRRLAAFEQSLDQKQQDLERRFNLPNPTPYIVYHNAYQYFESSLGLSPALALLENPDIQPGMREVLATRQEVESIQADCVILEPDSNVELLDTLMPDNSARRVTIDLLGYDIGIGEQAYLELIDKVAAGFASCLKTN